MSGVFESIERYPVEYLPTGDRALLIAWTVQPAPSWTQLDVCQAILCLEDGTVRLATLDEFKFDYRYNNATQEWVDVSVIPEGPTVQELPDDGDTDQEPPDDGGSSVQGRVPDLGGTSEGDPVDEP